MNPPPEAPDVTFNILSETFEADEEVIFEITVENFESIMGLQNALQWDTTVIEFVEMEVNSELASYFLYHQPEVGTLSFILSDNMFTGMNLPDNEVLLTLTFTAKEASNTSSSLFFVDNLLPAQIVWRDDLSNLFILDGTYNALDPITTIHPIESLSFFEISPNPATDFLSVNAQFMESENIKLSITNSLGQTVYTESLVSETIHKNISLDGLPKGMYYISIQNRNRISTKAFIKQ